MVTLFQETALPSTGAMVAQVLDWHSLGGAVSAPTDALKSITACS